MPPEHPICPGSEFKAKLGAPPGGVEMRAEEEEYSIDLPTALRLTQTRNPWIAEARERVREALAVQERTEAQVLPDLIFNPNWNRHDGQIQRFNGEVPTISRSSLGVTGGPQLRLDTGNALYGPLVTRQLTNARAAGAAAESNEQLLEVALAYIELVQTRGEATIALEALQNAQLMLELMLSFQKAGKVAPAETARARTEVHQRERELVQARAQIKVVSTRLAELLNLPSHLVFRPDETTVRPIALVSAALPVDQLVAQSMMYRPELAEFRALTDAAGQRLRAAQMGPFLPHLLLDYNAGGFGGGPNSYFGNFNTRGDFTAMAVWRLESLGVGYRAETRAMESRLLQGQHRLIQVESAVAAQVARNYHLASSRQAELPAAKSGVESALESYRLNLDRVRKAPDEARPIELLQAIQALNRARLDYVRIISDYNRTQFRLYTAIGYAPQCALTNEPVGKVELAPTPRPLPPDAGK